jgi:signal transduction histidine kinase
VAYDSQHPDPTWAQRDASALPHVRAAAQGESATTEGFTSPIDGTRRLGAAAPIPRLGWVVTADRLLAEVLRPIEDAARYEAAFSALTVLLALVLALMLAVTLNERLRKLHWAVAAVRQGDYTKRISVGGRDELTDLAAGFNEMMARLQALEQEREAFAAMVAHDLRSPLTTVRGTAQLLQRRLPGEAAVQQGLATIVRESDRVARLATDLSDVTRAAVGQLEIRPQRVDLVALVAQAVDRLRAVPVSQPIRLEADPGPLWVDADPERIAQVLDNLLGNAAKYSPPDQPITVQVRGGSEARVCVEDRGAGIAPEEQPHLFDRFYRTSLARDGPVAGTGLGLYISQEIAQAHHGRITVDSGPGKGSRFTLCLPLAPKPASARSGR